MHGIHDSTGHSVHNIIIYNIVSHNFQFLFFYISLIFWQFMNTFHNLNLKSQISTNKSDNVKTIGKLEVMRDNIVDEYVPQNVTTRNMKSVQ